MFPSLPHPSVCVACHALQAAQAQGNLQFLESVFNGTHKDGIYPPLPTVLPGVSLEAFKHTIALVSGRDAWAVLATRPAGSCHQAGNHCWCRSGPEHLEPTRMTT